MIENLGIKRILIILVLLFVNAVLCALWYGYLTPDILKKERALNAVKSNVAQTEADTRRMYLDLAQINEQKERFSVVKSAGFLETQDRRQAELILEGIQEKAGVNKATVTIRPAKDAQHAEAKKADYRLLESPISIDVAALDDLDILRYIMNLKASFPGHLTIESFDLTRKSELNDPVLRAIASGDNPDLVSGQIGLIWRTMIPDPNAAVNNSAGGQ